MDSIQILIELPFDDTADLIGKLNAEGIKHEDPTRIDNFDGVTMAAIVVVVTPVLAKAITSIIEAMKGRKGAIRFPDGSGIQLENASDETIRMAVDRVTKG